jgi:hypothetical protein
VSAPEYDRLLRELSEAEAQFVLIGALALGAWGVVRATKDVCARSPRPRTHLAAAGRRAALSSVGPCSAATWASLRPRIA